VPAREVEVAPAQRDELASPKAGERGGKLDRGVLFGCRGAHERHHVLGREHVDVRRVWTGFSRSVTGLRGSFQARRARLMTP
jgi:hypothetical protein